MNGLKVKTTFEIVSILKDTETSGFYWLAGR